MQETKIHPMIARAHKHLTKIDLTKWSKESFDRFHPFIESYTNNDMVMGSIVAAIGNLLDQDVIEGQSDHVVMALGIMMAEINRGYAARMAMFGSNQEDLMWTLPGISEEPQREIVTAKALLEAATWLASQDASFSIEEGQQLLSQLSHQEN